MEITVNTIEEYKAAKAKGYKKIMIGDNNELWQYVVNNNDKTKKEKLASRQGFEKKGENLVYNLNSKFNFGKHKENELRYVYKCDPYYVEWCLLNADGFIISSETINKLSNEKVFDVDDLMKFGKMVDENILELNLISFPINSNNFPFSNTVKEVFFSFSKSAIETNFKKSNSKINTSDFFKGGNWGMKSFVQDKRMKKSSIKIKK